MAATNCPDHVAQSVECGASIVEALDLVQFALGRTIFNQYDFLIFNVLQVIRDYERRKKEIEELSEIVSLTTNKLAVTSFQIQIILFLDPNY